MVKTISVWISLVACGAAIAQQETQYLHKVFSTPTLRFEFTQFLDNVLKQVPSDQFFKLIDANKRMKETQQDSKVYKMLQGKIHKVKPWLPVFNQLKSLKHQKVV